MATTPQLTYNTDVYGIVRRINRFIEEVTKSVSSNVSGTNSFDVSRAKSYVAAIRSYAGWVTGQPALDLPETAPRSIALPVSPVIPPMENESMLDLATLFELARDEISGSQSSRVGAGLMASDLKRLTAILDKADAFIVGYITVVDPLDVPESSPMSPMTGPGRTGV